MFNEGLKKIGEGAFEDCTSLQSIKLPSTVTEIGDVAFRTCRSLKDVVLNDCIQKIGHGSFCGCVLLERITFPSTLITIGLESFLNCKSLKEVVLNNGLARTMEGSFHGCDALESITLPSTLIGIDAGTFCGCHNLREVHLHEGLQWIGTFAFSRCTSLERLTFPIISKRLDNVIQTGIYPRAEAMIDEVRGRRVERRGSELSISAILYLDRGRTWNTIKESLHQIIKWISYYEVKEATTLFELALWKAKIEQVEEDCNPDNREECRIEVPGPVKDAILQYLS